MLDTLSFLLLAVTGALCTFAVFSHRFDDTLAQRVGLSAVAIWCFARLPEKLDGAGTEPIHFVLHLGLAVYAIGTYLKISRAPKLRRRSTDHTPPYWTLTK